MIKKFKNKYNKLHNVDIIPIFFNSYNLFFTFLSFILLCDMFIILKLGKYVLVFINISIHSSVNAL